jgi:hypothetical protein
MDSSELLFFKLFVGTQYGIYLACKFVMYSMGGTNFNMVEGEWTGTLLLFLLWLKKCSVFAYNIVVFMRVDFCVWIIL